MSAGTPFQLSKNNANQPLSEISAYTYDNPFLGDSRATPTIDCPVGANTTFDRFTLLQRDPDTGAVTPQALNNDGTPVLEPYGVSAVAASTGAGEATAAAVWVGGKFNHLRIKWPAALDTYAKRRAFIRKYFQPAILDVGEVKNGALPY